MNIFGVTYTFTANYGTCLQSYALQTVIEQMQAGGEAIRYRLVPIAKSPGYPKPAGNPLKQWLKDGMRRHARKQFVGFETEHLHYAPVYPLEQFAAYNDSADAFVCGSDVIWNPKFNHGLHAYFLEFSKRYAFSYAASFGQSDIAPERLPEIGGLLARLNAISVREQKSAEIAAQCTDRPVDLVVDPVLLLPRTAWETLAMQAEAPTKQPFIFVYTVNSSTLLRQFVKKLSKQTGCAVVVSGGNPGSLIKFGVWRVHTPQEWLRCIRDASYVVTDSFHGTAFATLFQKTLFTIVEGGAMTGFHMRMGNFLTGIGLADRLFATLPETIDCSPVDFTAAQAALDAQIAHSKAYLQRALDEAYQQKPSHNGKESTDGTTMAEQH